MTQHLDFDQWAERLKVLSSPVRLEIIQSLRAGPRTVCELSEELQRSVINASHHLQILHRGRLVVRVKQGRFVRYRLPDDLFKLVPDQQNIEILDLGCCRLEFDIERNPAVQRRSVLASGSANEYYDVR